MIGYLCVMIQHIILHHKTTSITLGQIKTAIRLYQDWNILMYALQVMIPMWQNAQMHFVTIEVKFVWLTKHSSGHKTRINDSSCGIRMWAQVSFVLSQIMRLRDGQTDRRTDGRTDSFIMTRPPCIQCSAVMRRRLSVTHVCLSEAP